jgi:hypothetical protein
MSHVQKKVNPHCLRPSCERTGQITQLRYMWTTPEQLPHTNNMRGISFIVRTPPGVGVLGHVAVAFRES